MRLGIGINFVLLYLSAERQIILSPNQPARGIRHSHGRAKQIIVIEEPYCFRISSLALRLGQVPAIPPDIRAFCICLEIPLPDEIP